MREPDYDEICFCGAELGRARRTIEHWRQEAGKLRGQVASLEQVIRDMHAGHAVDVRKLGRIFASTTGTSKGGKPLPSPPSARVDQEK